MSLQRKIAAHRCPLYTADSVRPVTSLLYDWTGWTSQQTPLPPSTSEAIRASRHAWQTDGLRLREHRIRDDSVQILFEAGPQVSPVLCAARAKGRLQHVLRDLGTSVAFSRKVAFRSLGENTRDTIEQYLAAQVRKERFADARFASRMQEYTLVREQIDLSKPAITASGRYWYNLHVVLVTAGRCRIVDYGMLSRIRDAAIRIADAKGCSLRSLSVMPDHLHVMLRGDPGTSPERIALGLLNGTARLVGLRTWRDEYYAGTFSEYEAALLRRVADGSSHPATQGRRGRD